MSTPRRLAPRSMGTPMTLISKACSSALHRRTLLRGRGGRGRFSKLSQTVFQVEPNIVKHSTVCRECPLGTEYCTGTLGEAKTMALLRRRAVAVTPCKWTIRAVHPAQQGIAPCALAFLLLASLLATARFAAPARAADEPLHIEYTLVLPPDRSPRVDVIVTLRAADAGGVSAQMTLPEGVTPTDLWSPDGSA